MTVNNKKIDDLSIADLLAIIENLKNYPEQSDNSQEILRVVCEEYNDRMNEIFID